MDHMGPAIGDPATPPYLMPVVAAPTTGAACSGVHVVSLSPARNTAIPQRPENQPRPVVCSPSVSFRYSLVELLLELRPSFLEFRARFVTGASPKLGEFLVQIVWLEKR